MVGRMCCIYEARTLLRVQHTPPCPTAFEHDTDTYDYSELHNLFKLLAVSACQHQCRDWSPYMYPFCVRCRCIYMCVCM